MERGNDNDTYVAFYVSFEVTDNPKRITPIEFGAFAISLYLVLRSQNLRQLLHKRGGNTNGWRPLVTLTADPQLGHNHCAIHETTLGSDGQNPNSKTGLDLESPRLNTKLLFEVVHFPQAAKKKARRLNRTVIGSCVYEMGELVRLANEQERSSKQIVSISLTPSGSGPRVRHTKRMRNSTTNASSDKGFLKISPAGPSLQIRVTPPTGMLMGGLSGSRLGTSLSSCEEESEDDDEDGENEDEETQSLVLSLDSSKTLNDEDTSTIPPSFEPESSTQAGLRRRRRRVRRHILSGYACESGDEVEEEKWISESASESASDVDEEDRELEETAEDDNDCSDPKSSSEWSPWPWIDHVAPILGILGMAQPNPGILPSYRDSLEDDHRHQSNIVKEVIMEVHETNVDTSPNIEDEPTDWAWEWWERLLCLFTVYRELRIAEYEEMGMAELSSSSVELSLSQSPRVSTPRISNPSLRSLSISESVEGKDLSLRLGRYDRIYQRLQVEWTYVGGLLIGLAGIDAAIFAISPSSSDTSFSDIASGKDSADLASSSSLFPVDSYAREAVSLSTISTALGLLCDAYFLLNYAWGDVNTFLNRARSSLHSSSSVSSSSPQAELPVSASPLSQSWGYFALSSRIPAICMFLSLLFIGAFLLIVASEAAPPAGLWFLGVLVGMGMWMQYVVRFGKIVGRGVRGVGRGVRNIMMWVGSSASWVGGKTRGLFVRSERCHQDAPAVDGNTDTRKKSVIIPLPVKIRPEGRGRHS
ncbi:hypothetical protein J3R30DRAFT_3708239 [Lentinula aciculospora]|uniref:Uncharacterized protein n=1 Tax=Lentinula aciculospora TaxID=153920 RepID=A0A9W9A2T6_9AGAR|nr:hypothetical protein J3R30DRAFT_3708239 [Lentinula aciculospora]